MNATRRMVVILLLLAGAAPLLAQEGLGTVRQRDRLRLFLPPDVDKAFPLPDVGYHGHVSAVVVRPGTDTLLLSTRSGTTWKLSQGISGFRIQPMLEGGSYSVEFERLDVARGRRRIGAEWTGPLGAVAGGVVGAGVLYVLLTSGSEGDAVPIRAREWPILMLPGAVVGGVIGVLVGVRRVDVWRPVTPS